MNAKAKYLLKWASKVNMIRSFHVSLLKRFGTDSRLFMKELIKLKKPRSVSVFGIEKNRN